MGKRTGKEAIAFADLPMTVEWDDPADETDFQTVKDTEQQEFLRHFRKFGIPAYCCRLSGIAYSKLKGWLDIDKGDKEFQKAYNFAKEEAADFVHTTSFFRAVLGYTEITETDKKDKFGGDYTETKRRNVYDQGALQRELDYRQPGRKVRVDVTSGDIPIKLIQGIDIDKDI